MSDRSPNPPPHSATTPVAKRPPEPTVDRILDKYLARRPETKPTPDDDSDSEQASQTGEDATQCSSLPADDPDTPDDHGSFGYLRGIRDRAVMLELRKRDGSIMAIAYAYIERIEFDPSDGITIHALGRKITIKGRSLNTPTKAGVRLFGALTRHRVPWVTETAQPPICLSQESTDIQAINLD